MGREVSKMSESILTSTKKTLGLSEDYTAFDADIIMHINSVFTILNDLGIGPDTGYMIEDAEDTWDMYLGTDLNLNLIRTYMYLRVRLLFDPPATSFHIKAIENELQELEWRISMRREATAWVNPNDEVVV
jgi:hypothetical protein